MNIFANMYNDFTASFVQNFIEKDRWKLITNGLATTLEVTFLAVLLGIALGFIIAVIRATSDKTGKLKFLNGICKIYLTVLRGTPIIVQLMIMFFVVFSSSRNKFLPAVLAFGLNSAAYVAEIIRSGIMSIDEGQMEAGRSLGFNYVQTMYHIIMPQALKNVLPALGNEFISLLKETSVSTAIGLSDLTYAANIIRSRTYEAFLPLIAVAVIYLVIVIILSWLVGLLERRLRNSEK